MTDSLSESYQWMIIYLNHTNHWYYVCIIPMTYSMVISMIQVYYQSLVWFRHIISHWFHSYILSVIGMIQTYWQSLVWLRYIISHWYDSDRLSVIGLIQVYYQSLDLNHTNHWWYVWTIPMTYSMSESYQWLIIYLNHTNH
jgi:hypothetical protein